MANLSNNKRDFLPFRLSNHSLIDFFLSKGDVKIYKGNTLYDECITTGINTNDNNSIVGDTLISNKYFWDESINDGISLYDIGVTGIDNGLVSYDPQKQKVMDIFTKTIMDIDEGDMRLSLKPVKGYYHNLDYNIEDGVENEMNFKSLKGGFYQGFYKLHEYPYQVLPNKPKLGWGWDFVLRPYSETFENTLNERFPENKGIFFYMGARAENKFWYFNQQNVEMQTSSDYFLDDYLESNDEVKIEDTKTVSTSSGIEYGESNITEITTDNKYVAFGRHKDGINTETYDGEDFKIFLKKRRNDNKYLTYNRTKDGMNTEKATDEYLYDNDMDIENDIQLNSMAFRIKDDGSIGYRYYSKCVGDNDNLVEEYSKPGVIDIDKWNYIHVKMITNEYIENPECDNRQRKCKFYFYNDGRLVFISKEVDEPIFKPLNEHREKQQGVAYNISLGGGSLGLYETILHDDPEHYERVVFPIEKYFAGSMFGDVLKFRFYNCDINFSQIKNNYVFERNYLNKYNIYK